MRLFSIIIYLISFIFIFFLNLQFTGVFFSVLVSVTLLISGFSFFYFEFSNDSTSLSFISENLVLSFNIIFASYLNLWH